MVLGLCLSLDCALRRLASILPRRSHSGRDPGNWLRFVFWAFLGPNLRITPFGAVLIVANAGKGGSALLVSSSLPFREGMGLKPKCSGRDDRINTDVCPPNGFVATAVDLAMVPAAQRDDELIADLAAERPSLGKSQMVSVRRPSAANQARTPGDRLNVLAVAYPAQLR